MLFGALAVIWLEGALHKNLLISPRFGAPWATTKERKRKAPLRAHPNPVSRGSRVLIFHARAVSALKNCTTRPPLTWSDRLGPRR